MRIHEIEDRPFLLSGYVEKVVIAVSDIQIVNALPYFADLKERRAARCYPGPAIADAAVDRCIVPFQFAPGD